MTVIWPLTCAVQENDISDADSNGNRKVWPGMISVGPNICGTSSRLRVEDVFDTDEEADLRKARSMFVLLSCGPTYPWGFRRVPLSSRTGSEPARPRPVTRARPRPKSEEPSEESASFQQELDVIRDVIRRFSKWHEHAQLPLTIDEIDRRGMMHVVARPVSPVSRCTMTP